MGLDHDTATFAVRSIRRWWHHMGRRVYLDAATSLLITADAGRKWRAAPPLEVGAAATREPDRAHHQVCHFPPGTSKWNRIDHRRF